MKSMYNVEDWRYLGLDSQESDANEYSDSVFSKDEYMILKRYILNPSKEIQIIEC